MLTLLSHLLSNATLFREHLLLRHLQFSVTSFSLSLIKCIGGQESVNRYSVNYEANFFIKSLIR